MPFFVFSICFLIVQKFFCAFDQATARNIVSNILLAPVTIFAEALYVVPAFDKLTMLCSSEGESDIFSDNDDIDTRSWTLVFT